MIKATITLYYSRKDKAGNCYWAFSYVNVKTGKQVDALTGGGESNIDCMIRRLHPDKNGMADWSKVSLMSVDSMSLRKFNMMTKDWPYAGSEPKELAQFVKDRLRVK